MTTGHLVYELQVALCVVLILRTDSDDDISELTATTSLLLVDLTMVLNGLRDSLLVVNLRLTLVTLNLELTLQTVDNDIEVKLTHTGDDGLATLLVGMNSEGRILFGELSKTVVKLSNVGLALRLHSYGDHRIREGHRLEDDRLVLVTQGITGTDILETYTCADITSVDALHRNLLMRVHLEQTADTLLLARTGVVDVRTGLHRTRVYAEVYETTHERIGSNLKCESCCRLFLKRLTILFLTSLRVRTLDGGSVLRRGQESASVVEQRLHTLVLIRRTEEHRAALHIDSTFTDSSDDLVLSNGRRIIHVLLHEVVAVVSSLLKEFVTPLVGIVYEISGDIINLILSTHGLIVPQDSLHLDKVNNALEVLLCTDRNLDNDRVSTQDILHLLNGLEEVST